MRLYKVHKVHALVPGDRERRLNYCRWLVGHQQRSRFIEHVIWTDEATFTRNEGTLTCGHRLTFTPANKLGIKPDGPSTFGQ
uniref:SFRICE_032587 n=1 Tax=Spodoptera frugiperda TaxID=7108 RepID=A0A2H1WKB9_SPOFR